MGDEDVAFSGLRITGESAIVRIFHADRNSESSVLKVRFSNMLLNVNEVNVAQADTDGVEIAYEGESPDRVVPLGESITIGPSRSQILAVVMNGQLGALAVVGVFLAVTIVVAWRAARRHEEKAEARAKSALNNWPR